MRQPQQADTILKANPTVPYAHETSTADFSIFITHPKSIPNNTVYLYFTPNTSSDLISYFVIKKLENECNFYLEFLIIPMLSIIVSAVITNNF